MEDKVINYQIRPIPYDPWDSPAPIVVFSATKEKAEEMLKTYEFTTGEKLMLTLA